MKNLTKRIIKKCGYSLNCIYTIQYLKHDSMSAIRNNYNISSPAKNLISMYFRDLSNLKLNMFDNLFYSCKDFLHFKKSITSSNSFIFNLIYTSLGSKSSFNILKDNLKLENSK